MITRYNIGEKVLIKGTVERITISEGKITYVINTKTNNDYIYIDEYAIAMSEEELDELEQENDD